MSTERTSPIYVECNLGTDKVMCKYLKAIILSFIFLLLPKIPFVIGLVLVWLCIGITTIKCPPAALVAICFMQCFAGLLRWKNLSSILLAGFRAEIIMIFLFFYLVRITILNKNKFLGKSCNNKRIKNEKLYIYFSIIYLFIFWILFISVAKSLNIIEFFLSLRETIMILLLLPITLQFIKYDPDISNHILLAICLGGACIASLNLLHYFYKLPLPWPSLVFASNKTDYILYRTFFDISFARANPILGGIGPGGAGAFYASIAMCCNGCLILLNLKRLWKIALFIAFCILLTMAFCFMSYSSFVVIALGLFALILKLKPGMLKITSIIIFGCFTVSLLFTNILGTCNGYKSNTLFSYSSKIAHNTYRGISKRSAFDNIFGEGLSLKTGALLGVDRGNKDDYLRNLADDQWWFVVLNQFGIIGMLLTLLIIIPAIAKYLKASPRVNDSNTHYLICAGILLFSLCGYAHGFPLFSRPFDLPFVMVLAIIIGIKVNYKNDNCTSFRCP